MAASLPPAPASLKSVQHHLKTAQEHDGRDPVVAYYCRMYVLEQSLKLDKSSPEAKKFLLALMTLMEQLKASLAHEEAITSEMVGQAHVENYALKVFAFADTEDRAARHTKNVVKSFYTAGMLFDVLSIFPETHADTIEPLKKYAKYKAAYIHKCLKSGEAPVPGPYNEEGEDMGFAGLNLGIGGFSDAGASSSGASSSGGGASASGASSAAGFSPSGAAAAASGSYSAAGAGGGYDDQETSGYAHAAGSDVGFEIDWALATKNTKYAMSSLTYEDRESAVDYLQKAINLLTLGHE